MPTYSSNSSVGSSVETAEIEDSAVTAAKLDTGWKLHSSGVDNIKNGTELSFTSLPAKYRWKLTLHLVMPAETPNISINNINSDTGNNYSDWKLESGGITETTGSSLIRLLHTAASDEMGVSVEFNGQGDEHTFFIKGFALETSLQSYIRGYHAGSADITSFDLVSNSTNDVSVRWALYYNEDLEDAT